MIDEIRRDSWRPALCASLLRESRRRDKPEYFGPRGERRQMNRIIQMWALATLAQEEAMTPCFSVPSFSILSSSSTSSSASYSSTSSSSAYPPAPTTTTERPVALQGHSENAAKPPMIPRLRDLQDRCMAFSRVREEIREAYRKAIPAVPRCLLDNDVRQEWFSFLWFGVQQDGDCLLWFGQDV